MLILCCAMGNQFCLFINAMSLHVVHSHDYIDQIYIFFYISFFLKRFRPLCIKALRPVPSPERGVRSLVLKGSVPDASKLKELLPYCSCGPEWYSVIIRILKGICYLRVKKLVLGRVEVDEDSTKVKQLVVFLHYRDKHYQLAKSTQCERRKWLWRALHLHRCLFLYVRRWSYEENELASHCDPSVQPRRLITELTYSTWRHTVDTQTQSQFQANRMPAISHEWSQN